MSRVIYNLGCGRDRHTDAINLDLFKTRATDGLIDLDYPHWWEKLPLGVDEIRAYHVLEHLRNVEEFFENAFLALRPGGLLKIRVPCGPYEESLRNPDHKHFFVPRSFEFFDNDVSKPYDIQKLYSLQLIRTKLRFDGKMGWFWYHVFRTFSYTLALSFVFEIEVWFRRKKERSGAHIH